MFDCVTFPWRFIPLQMPAPLPRPVLSLATGLVKTEGCLGSLNSQDTFNVNWAQASQAPSLYAPFFFMKHVKNIEKLHIGRRSPKMTVCWRQNFWSFATTTTVNDHRISIYTATLLRPINSALGLTCCIAGVALEEELVAHVVHDHILKDIRDITFFRIRVSLWYKVNIVILGRYSMYENKLGDTVKNCQPWRWGRCHSGCHVVVVITGNLIVIIIISGSSTIIKTIKQLIIAATMH